METRLFGLETEYAIRFASAYGGHPGNDKLFEAMEQAIKSLVASKPGRRRDLQSQFFVENGGNFAYEHQFFSYHTGLLEGGTPECRNPGELLLYQRAQERLLEKAIPLAERLLEQAGTPGELGLLKNCRDAEGHVYGAQENYEATIARGVTLLLYRLGLCLILPIVGLGVLVAMTNSLVLATIVFTLVILWFALELACQLIALLTGTDGEWLQRGKRALLSMIGYRDFASFAMKLEFLANFPVTVVMLYPLNLLLKALAFRSIRRNLTAFFASRVIISGAGSLTEDGGFHLSEKGTAVKRLTRYSVGPTERALFDFANLLKDAMLLPGDLVMRRFASLRQIFAARQRLQIGLSDSNRADVAEYLKVGITALMVRLEEEGRLADAPRLKHPVAAIRAMNADSTLKVQVETTTGERVSALTLQRRYLEKAREYLRTASEVLLEDREIVRLWGEVLDLLEKDPTLLLGRLDWVTKRYLLETAGAFESFAARKKIDLRYHEIGRGYFDELRREGLTQNLVEDSEVERAIKEPPLVARAQMRSRLIRSLAFREDRIIVGWDRVQVGGSLKGKVIELDRFRERVGKREGEP